MPSQMGLLDLARHLRQEFLFVSSEKQSIQNLNEKVLKTVEHLYHLSWIARQQRINLDNLTMSHKDDNPAVYCQRASVLEHVNFIDSYKQLGVNDSMYAEFLQQVRENPKLLAMCLNAGEHINMTNMHNAVNIIMAALYGNCILPEDEISVLNLLKELMSLQLAVSDNPRRLLRHGSCAFSQVYKSFNECLFSAKIFLTAALYEPIMHVLMEDDLFLDIDPSKAAVRFHPHERLRHFGKEGTQEYAANLQRHRTWIINKLFNLTMHFINGIRNNLCCFPQSLSWLARQMYNSVMKAKRVEVREVGAMCADLVFAFFICPAIVNPAPYGISDIHISDIARFNLMQVAQILQVLAMSKWEEIDSKLMDLYGKFEKDSMSSLLDLILEGSTSENEVGLVNQFQELNRSAILITESELMTLVTFLRSVEHDTQDNTLKKMLFSLISHLPSPTINIPSVIQNGDMLTSTPSVQMNESYSLLSSKKASLEKQQSNSVSNSDNLEDSGSIHESENMSAIRAQLEDVLVVPIPGMEFDCPGFLNEEKVLAAENQRRNQARKADSFNGDENDSLAGSTEIVEKRTRFSLSQDQESVGTSDNLEAISEAASNHSVASSVDLENENDENENDNLSDMVSANVSGRGTPNVSGRDTPSSQLEGEEREQRPLDLVSGQRKQNQEDIEGKFGKFEIQPLIEGDETKSMVSDTWSTDVLASDSETVEQSDISSQMTLECQSLSVLDASETASQSDAWSTDVLASDTERLLDVDTDDTASVARSDDTGRSEADGEVPQGLDMTPMDSKDFMDLEHAESAGGGSDYQLVMSQIRSTNFSAESSKTRLQELRSEVEEDGDYSLFPEKGVPKVSSTQKNYSSNDAFKLGDVLCPEVENLIHLGSSLESTSAQSSLNEGLSSMQSLGRVSLVVRELPDAEDQDSGSLLLDSLQETVNISLQNDRPAHRSSIADILSLDLTRTLNLRTEVCASEDPLRKSESSSSLMEIEREILGEHLLHDRDVNSDFKKVENYSGMGPHGERAVKRKLPDSVFLDEVGVRLSAASVSSSGSSTGSEVSGNVKAAVEADLNARFNSEDLTSQSRLNSTPPSMGAIPKSISFDKAVHSTENLSSEDKFAGDKNKKGLFKLSGFKFTFKGRNRKSHLPYRPESCFKADDVVGIKGFRASQSSFSELRALQLEAGDEILAKYRKKSPSVNINTMTKASLESIDLASGVSDNLVVIDSGPQIFDPISVETSPTFYNAKRKLRLVLGSSDLQTLPWLNSSRPLLSGQRLQDNELVAFLKVLLAEAINLQLRPLLSHLREALRCIQMFDDIGCQKLFSSLRDDYKKRAPYISYLVRCRQGLLSTLSHLETLIERVQRDKQVCNHNLVMLCVKLFMERHERPRQVFLRKFLEFTVADEKTMLVQSFLSFLFTRMENDVVWQTANECQLEHAQVVIERVVMGQIYTSALHPNGDGDLLRDKVLQEHMQKLSQVITPSHKDLRIPKQYHSECPWPSAQAELELINAYKTPRDKIQCVVRCCSTIMNLLSMASERHVPTADDLMPVLVFVLIKANPSNMLSTVQYVNTFYEKQLEGEEAYWWTQFCCAVEFIKTMDY